MTVSAGGRNVGRRVRRLIRASGIGQGLNRIARHLPRGVQEWYERAKARAGFGRAAPLSPHETLERHYRQALDLLVDAVGREAIGDYLEFGVYAGGSIASMHRALESAGLDDVRIFGFDSFEGLPDAAEIEGGGRWQPGQFRSSAEFTAWNLERSGIPRDRVTLVPGWFEETATEATATKLGMRHASVVLIDCDLYSSARTALEFCATRLGPTAVIFFDEWSVGAPGAAGFDERRAFEEFLDAHPEFRAEEQPELGGYKEDSRAFLVWRMQDVAT